MLRDSGVCVFGCGFVHDKMRLLGIGRPPVTMNVIKNNVSPSLVRAVFGKATYVRPILLSPGYAPGQGRASGPVVGRGLEHDRDYEQGGDHVLVRSLSVRGIPFASLSMVCTADPYIGAIG